MSKTVTIPTDGMNPFVVVHNGEKYVYTPGATVEVPDGVALEIEEYKRWRKKYYGDNVPPFENANALGDITAEVGQTIVVKSVDENGRPTAWEAADIGKWEHICDITTTEEVESIEITENADGVSLSELKYNEIWVAAKMIGLSTNTVQWWYCHATDDTGISNQAAVVGGTTGTKYISFYHFIRGNKVYSNDSSGLSAYGALKCNKIAWNDHMLDYYNRDHFVSLKFSTGIGIDTEIRIMGRRA